MPEKKSTAEAASIRQGQRETTAQKTARRRKNRQEAPLSGRSDSWKDSYFIPIPRLSESELQSQARAASPDPHDIHAQSIVVNVHILIPQILCQVQPGNDLSRTAEKAVQNFQLGSGKLRFLSLKGKRIRQSDSAEFPYIPSYPSVRAAKKEADSGQKEQGAL